MTKHDDDKPSLDLHPSEWSHDKKREPFWGWGAPNPLHLAIQIAVGAAAAAIVLFLLTGELPGWLR